MTGARSPSDSMQSDEDTTDQETEEEEEECDTPEMKTSRNKALLDFRLKVKEAILAHQLFVEKPQRDFSQENGENLKDFKLWGVPLFPGEGHHEIDTVLIKFLKVKHYKVPEAFTLLRKTLKWRADFHPDENLEEDLLADGLDNMWFTSGRDKEGRPLCYNMLGKESQKKLLNSGDHKCQDYLRWRVLCVEKGIQTINFKPDGVNSFIQIIDLKSSPGTAMKEVKLICKKMINLLHDHYPEIVYKNLIVNVPPWFLAVNALNLRLVTQKSKNKFIFVKPSKVTETLLKYATIENILVEYGGLRRENDTEFSTEDEVLEVNIRANTTEYIQIPIHETGVTVTWDVTVAGFEVTYKEEFIPDDDCSYEILLQEKKMGESIRNSFHIREPGMIVITIVNGSFTRKKAFYRYKSRITVPMYLSLYS